MTQQESGPRAGGSRRPGHDSGADSLDSTARRSRVKGRAPARPGGSAVLTPAGQPRPRRRSERVPVLAVVHPDGYVGVYGDRERVSVHVAHALDVSRDAEVTADDYLDATLPARYRALHIPRNLLVAGDVRDCRTPEAERERLWRLDWVRACRELRAETHGRHTT